MPGTACPHTLAGRRDAGHHPEVGVDDPRAVAGRAGALGVGAEQRGLHAVGLGERLADRFEQARVGRRVAAARPADRQLIDRDHAVPFGHRALDERLLPEPATPVTTTRTPSGMSTSTSRRLWALAPRTSSRPDGDRSDDFTAARSSRWRPVSVPLARSPETVPLVDHLAAGRAGTRAEVNDVIGDGDRLGLVLHDQHGVALVP